MMMIQYILISSADIRVKTSERGWLFEHASKTQTQWVEAETQEHVPKGKRNEL
jgi:hypothetical protein